MKAKRLAILLVVLGVLGSTLLLLNPQSAAKADGPIGIGGTDYKAPPQSGVWPNNTVYLRNSSYSIVATTTTLDNGSYFFSMTGRSYGTYYIDDGCRYEQVQWSGSNVTHDLTGSCT